MTYLLFLGLVIIYNWRKFRKEKGSLIASLIDAKNSSHREMILGHHFYVLISEVFVAFIVAHFLADNDFSAGILGMLGTYFALSLIGFFFYQFFVSYLERKTNLELRKSFQQNLAKEFRVTFALAFLPIMIYAMMSWTFQDNVGDWGNLWIVGLVVNIIFVSVVTIVCTVIVMLKLIPNREVTEPEYLELIDRRLAQIGAQGMRVRWIESDLKNAFVVGLKLMRFSNQTMFIGRRLRTMMSLEEFDAIICHELAHVANRHINKRIIELIKSFIILGLGILFIMMGSLGISALYFGEDLSLHFGGLGFFVLILLGVWVFFNYGLLFDTYRSQELESDAYAVLNLGASSSGLHSALEKLTLPEDMPDYLKSRINKNERSKFLKWFFKFFSTHPDLEARMSSLKEKIENGLPFNYNNSSSRQIRQKMLMIFHWKFAIPLMGTAFLTLGWLILDLKKGKETISWIGKSSSQEIMSNQEFLARINTGPVLLLGKSYLYYVIKKNDPALIDHFLDRGANKGRALLYLAELKRPELFRKYFNLFQDDISEDEYFLVLRKSAVVGFIEGYRLLVNAKQFETLSPDYKSDLELAHKRERSPASDVKSN